MSSFIDFHVLQLVPPSCINRDDTGSPKSARFGGGERPPRPGATKARIASGVSLRTSSTTEATTREADVSEGVTPAALQTHKLTMPISSAKGIPVANTPDVSAQETVLARARAKQHTTTHQHPTQALLDAMTLRRWYIPGAPETADGSPPPPNF